jgi:hypothetical protein
LDKIKKGTKETNGIYGHDRRKPNSGATYRYKQNTRPQRMSDLFHGLQNERWRHQKQFTIYGLVVGQNLDMEHHIVLG